MAPHVITVIGAVASLCSIASFVPQAWKIIHTGKAKDVSAGMYALSVVGFSAWLIYGIALDAWPLIVANGLCLALSAGILVLKLLPQRLRNTLTR